MWCKEIVLSFVYDFTGCEIIIFHNFDGCFVFPWNGVCANMIGFAKAVVDGRAPLY